VLGIVVVDYILDKKHIQKKKLSVEKLWKILEEHGNIV